jgi:hypothetical protein
MSTRGKDANMGNRINAKGSNVAIGNTAPVNQKIGKDESTDALPALRKKLSRLVADERAPIQEIAQIVRTISVIEKELRANEIHASTLRLREEQIASLSFRREVEKARLKETMAVLQKSASAGTLNTKDNSDLMAAIVATINAM